MDRGRGGLARLTPHQSWSPRFPSINRTLELNHKVGVLRCPNVVPVAARVRTQSQSVILAHRWFCVPLMRSSPLCRDPGEIEESGRSPGVTACHPRDYARVHRRNHASSAAARPLKRTTSALRNRARLTARSATSTRSQSAASIIASCTDTATKPHAGPG